MNKEKTCNNIFCNNKTRHKSGFCKECIAYIKKWTNSKHSKNDPFLSVDYDVVEKKEKIKKSKRELQKMISSGKITSERANRWLDFIIKEVMKSKKVKYKKVSYTNFKLNKNNIAFLGNFWQGKRHKRIIKCSCGQNIEIETDKQGNITSATYCLER